ncbi:MAG TPA: TolC family protein [Paludibaculum sp.]|jgi:outer membrane protein TolC
MLSTRSTITLATVSLLTAGLLQAGGPEAWQRLRRPYQPPAQPPLELQNSPRFEKLLRAGNLYLSLDDAVALAIENNLDVEMQRYAAPIARTEVLRASGGGLLRGLLYTLAETNTGVGGPSAQLLTTASRTLPGSPVSTNPFETGALGIVQSNLSITGAAPLSSGPALPGYDPFLGGRLNYSHQSTPQTNLSAFGVPALAIGALTAGTGFRQGFASGAQLSGSFDNLRQTTNALRTSYSPYTVSSLGATLTQPLLRGFGYSVNRRFQRMAANEVRIADLLFQQQLINTVYGVARLYYDFVAINEDLKVKEETLRLAQQLFEDTKAQVDEGTLAKVELARVNAQVFSTRLDVERARASMEEQELILKNVLTRRGGEDPLVRAASIIPVSTLGTPSEEQRTEDELLAMATQNRPDLSQAELQIANSEISLQGARNALKPQIDLVAFAQNGGLAGEVNPVALLPDSTFLGGYGSALAQILRRNYPSYGGGIQIDLPLRNRVAQADLARDEIQVRQSRLRQQQLRNQARLEVADALIALRRAKSAFEAAAQARAYQEVSLQAEQAKFEVGASTSYFVIQFQSFLALARSTEVAARSAYIKARTALQRATGSILADYHISIDAARAGQM